MFTREKTRRIYLGSLPIGNGAPVTVQTMTKTKTHNIHKTIDQIKRCEEIGCDIIRVAVPDKASAIAVGKIKTNVRIPVIADIHYDYRLAIISIDEGVDGIRINPGNIGDAGRVRTIIKKALHNKTVIRIGINSGSIEKGILNKYRMQSPDALVESAIRTISVAEELGFYNIKVSLKATDVLTTISAYRRFAEIKDYPLHIGITESGTEFCGAIKSAIGIGILLNEGIGDTIRVSLPAEPEKEVIAGLEILRSLNLREEGIRIIACPTCGRCEVNVSDIMRDIEACLRGIRKRLTIAVMGCVVNGPGEARFADIAVVGGKKSFLLYKRGKKVRKVKPEDVLDELRLLIGEF